MGTDVNTVTVREAEHVLSRTEGSHDAVSGSTSVLLTPVLSDSLTSKWPLTSRAVQIEEPVFALNLDPIQELSEEDKGKRDGKSIWATRLHATCMDASVWSGQLLLYMSLRSTEIFFTLTWKALTIILWQGSFVPAVSVTSICLVALFVADQICRRPPLSPASMTVTSILLIEPAAWTLLWRLQECMLVFFLYCVEVAVQLHRLILDIRLREIFSSQTRAASLRGGQWRRSQSLYRRRSRGWPPMLWKQTPTWRERSGKSWSRLLHRSWRPWESNQYVFTHF